MKKLLFLVLFLTKLFSDCSSFIGEITINELYKADNDDDTYAELKILDDSLKDENLTNWRFKIHPSGGETQEYNLTHCGDDDYIKVPDVKVDDIDTEDGTWAVILDGDGKFVDYFYISDETNDSAGKCDYDYDIDTDDTSSSTSVDYYRDPDGTGDWKMDECGGNFFENIMCDLGLSSAENSECSENSGSSVVVNDDTNGDEGDGCDNPDYNTIQAVLKDIRDGQDISTIKVCPNDDNKSAYLQDENGDIKKLDLNNSNMKNLAIKEINKTKHYYLTKDDGDSLDFTPIVINGIDGITINGAIINSSKRGIELNGSVEGFIMSDLNITADECGVFKIHQDNMFLNKIKMYGGSITSNDESALCLQDINDTNDCKNKFFSFKLKAPKFGFDMLNNVKGCALIANGEIDGDSGGICTDMNVSIFHSTGHKNRFRSKNMGIRVGGGAFGFSGIDLSIDKSSSNNFNSSSTTSCKNSDSDGYGVYIDKISDEFNFSIDNLKIDSNDKGMFVSGNSKSKFSISNSKFYSKQTAFEINASTKDWNITNTEFNSTDGYAFKITGGDKPILNDVSAVSKYGIYFTDVLNIQIKGKSSLRKVISTDGDGLYFDGESGDFDIKNMMITAPNGNGIVFKGSGDNFKLENNYFLNCGDYGVYFKGSNNKASSNAILSDNFFMNNKAGIKIENSSNSFDLNISNNTFFESSAINNDEDDIVVDSNYWGSFPFGNGKSDKDETPTSDGDKPKTDDNYLIYSPVKFEVIDYQFDECDDTQPQDTQKPIVSLQAKRYDTTRNDLYKINSSLEFNSSAYVEIENIELSDEVTFMAWVNFTNDGTIITDKDNNLTIQNSKVTFNLNLDGTINTLQTDTISKDEWHQIVACYDGNNMMIYVDGDKKSTTDASGFVTNYDSNITIGNKDINGTIDEVKILRISICDDDTIKKVYDYENDRKEYYTKRDRDLSSCAILPPEAHKFDAKDKGRDDNNISTKKIGDEVNLTIYTNRDFNGSVWSVIQEGDRNISDINKTSWSNETEKNITIVNIVKFSRKAHIYIKWDDNTSENDDGDINSTDNFAIIPVKYEFGIPSEIKAGESYSIEVNATDEEGKTYKDYNQTLDNSSDKNSTLIFIHKNGTKEENGSIELKFSDSKAEKEDFNISDIGEYSLELNDTNFAEVDKDDTPEANRTIKGSFSIKVVPYKFKVEVKTDKTSNNKDWLYQGQEYNYTIEANITALNKNGDILSHFDKDEYSTDVNASVKIKLKLIDSNDDVNLTYIKVENSEKTDNQLKIKTNDYEINYSIKDSNFTKGVSSIFGMVSYIKKDITKPNSPVELNITEVNTTSKVADNIGVKVDRNISYLYPRINTNDIITTIKTTPTKIKVLVYDKNETDGEQRLGESELINWYVNSDDDFSKIEKKEMHSSSKLNSEKIDINLTNDNIDSGEIKIEVDNNTTPVTTYGIIHLDTKEYLWYSKYNKAYSYDSDSNCLHHYCIDYSYKELHKSFINEVGSGYFRGSEVNNTLDNNTSRHGVKLYR